MVIEALRKRGARWLEERAEAAEARGEEVTDSYEEEMAFEEAGGEAETLEAFERKLPPRLRREQLVDQVSAPGRGWWGRRSVAFTCF